MPIQSSDMPAIEEIKQLKARYFRFLDTKQWTNLRGLFTDDAVFEGTFDPFKGPDDFIAGVSKFNQNTVTVHHGHMPEIRITSPTTARAIWALADFIEIKAAEGQPPGAQQRGFTGFGHYQEKYRKEGDTWKIAFMRLTRIRVDPLLGEGKVPELNPRQLRSVADNFLEEG